MRLILLTVLIASLAADRTSDEMTSMWVLNAVTNPDASSSTTKLNLTPTVVKAIPETKKPGTETNAAPSKLNLNPTKPHDSIDCMTKENEQGVCVLYYQCNMKTKTVIDDGFNLLDLRINNCRHYLEVCCKLKNVQNTKTDEQDQAQTENNSDLGMSPNRNTEQGSPPIWSSGGQMDNRGDSKITSIPQCGRSAANLVSPIEFANKNLEKNSGFSLYGDFPWMVALLKVSGSLVWSPVDYLGGGTLIHPSVVITVAHKLILDKKSYQANELKCRAGEWDTQTDLEAYPHQERNVRKYYVHEAYYRVSLYNDIALLILEKPFQLNNAPHIGIACLTPSPPPSDRVCYSMGWGRSDPNKKENAHILKKVRLYPIERGTCQDMMRQTRFGNFFELHESFICAIGDEKVDTCRGDGGSPLVCAVSNDPNETRYAVHGMVAYGLACFNTSIPGVYADTANLKSWIDGKMQLEGLDTQYYTL